jgi:LmbE family N-acetylglucosaminyl deacetylase
MSDAETSGPETAEAEPTTEARGPWSPPVRTTPVVGVFAHPDDAEIAVGGTLAKWVAASREVHLVILTNGDRGSQDPVQSREDLAAIRLRETEAAARVLGLASVVVFDTHDGDLENIVAIRERVVRRIREVRAETVVSVDPTSVFFGHRYYNHSDHRTAGWVALDSAFPGAGNPHFFSHHLSEGLRVIDVIDVWLGWTNEPNHVEDVTGHYDKAMDALAEHGSQLTEGIRHFQDRMREEAAKTGATIGAEHGEEFRVLDIS